MISVLETILTLLMLIFPGIILSIVYRLKR